MYCDRQLVPLLFHIYVSFLCIFWNIAYSYLLHNLFFFFFWADSSHRSTENSPSGKLSLLGGHKNMTCFPYLTSASVGDARQSAGRILGRRALWEHYLALILSNRLCSRTALRPVSLPILLWSFFEKTKAAYSDQFAIVIRPHHIHRSRKIVCLVSLPSPFEQTSASRLGSLLGSGNNLY